MSAPSAEWLAQQRWFAGKALATASIKAGKPMITVVGKDLEIALVEIGDDHYQLVSLGDHADSLDQPATARALLTALRDGSSAEGAAGVVSFHLADSTELAVHPVRPIGVEQSNTSLVVGDRWILKVFRRVQPGLNPELEVLRFLADRNAANVPRLAGWYEVSGGPVDGTLGVLESLVPDAADGWEWILDRLAHAPQDTIKPLHRLGSVIATLHRTLAEGDVANGFGTVPAGTGAARSIANGVAADAARVAASLQADQGTVRDALDSTAHHALELADGLNPGTAIRVHGDLHLGQLLLGPDGWTVIDWEGEPSRSLAARRAHQPALRDMAGLLRSLSYAAATVERSGVTRPLRGWLAAARSALLDGYLASADPALLPAGAVATKRLLDLLEIEKLVYEVGYEAANRPTWLDIPVSGLLHTLRSQTA